MGRDHGSQMDPRPFTGRSSHDNKSGNLFLMEPGSLGEIIHLGSQAKKVQGPLV